MRRPSTGSVKTSPTAKRLGVTGTPTFFLDGKKLTLSTEADFRQKLTEAAK